jgi:hypothetical protein
MTQDLNPEYTRRSSQGPNSVYVRQGITALIERLNDLRIEVDGFFPKPIQAGRLIANLTDYLSEALAVIDIPSPDGPGLAEINRVAKAVTEAQDDMKRIHEMSHEVEKWEEFPAFFRVEAITCLYQSLGLAVEASRHSYRAVHGLSPEEKEALTSHRAGGPLIVMGGEPPEVLKELFRKLRERMGGDE